MKDEVLGKWKKIEVQTFIVRGAMNRQAIVALLAVCSVFVPFAVAQKNELSGVLGRTFVSDQGIIGSTGFDRNVHFGKGLTFEVNYARHFLGTQLYSLAFEIPFAINPDEDLHAASPTPVPQQYRSFMAAPSVRVNLFPEVAISPWLSFGGGFAHFSESSTTSDGLRNTGSTGTNTGVLQAGAGLDVKLFKSFRVRAEVRDFWSGIPQLNVDTGRSRQHNYLVGGGLVYRF